MSDRPLAPGSLTPPPVTWRFESRAQGPGAAVAGGALGLLLALIVAIAAVAATVIGLLVAVAALVTRFAPKGRRTTPAQPPLLEGRATADGWVAEPTSPSPR